MDRAPRRIGIVGCGRVFERYHRRALARSADWEIVAACDLSAQRRERVRRSLPGIRVFESPAELLAHDGLEAILVATHPDSHAELALQGMESGVHVLVEKPMATRLCDAQRMVDAVQTAGTVLCVGFNRRFRDSYRKLRDELATGPGSLRAIRYSFAADAKWRPEASISPVPLDLVLHDVASHQIDLVGWITGLTVREASARRLGDGRAEGGGVELDLHLGPDPDIVAQCRATYAPRYLERLEVDLVDRTLVVRPGGLSRSRRVPDRLSEAGARIRELAHPCVRRAIGRSTRTHESFERQLASFADAIRGAPSGCADVHDGYRAVAVVEACRHSLAGGGTRMPVDTYRALAGA